MQTYQIITHSFKELSQDAQKQAIEKVKDSKELELNIQDQYEFFTEDQEEYLTGLNFDDVKLYYSLSYCQGDGLCFEGNIYLSSLMENEEFTKLLTEKQKKNVKRFLNCDDNKITITHRGNYYHNKSVSFDYSYYNSTSNNSYIEKLLDEVLEVFKDYYENLTNEIKKEGYAITEHYWKDENIIEFINDSEIEFLSSGTIYKLSK